MTLPMFAAEDITATAEDRDCWCTPAYIVDAVHGAFDGEGVDLDPCSNRYSAVRAREAWTRSHDGLSRDWSRFRTVYCNPPYSDPGPWMDLCAVHPEHGRKHEVIACIKSDTSTAWWHRSIWPKASAICFPTRRVEFVPPPGVTASTPNFAVALPYWGRRPERFVDAFTPIGKVVVLNA